MKTTIAFAVVLATACDAFACAAPAAFAAPTCNVRSYSFARVQAPAYAPVYAPAVYDQPCPAAAPAFAPVYAPRAFAPVYSPSFAPIYTQRSFSQSYSYGASFAFQRQQSFGRGFAPRQQAFRGRAFAPAVFAAPAVVPAVNVQIDNSRRGLFGGRR